MPPAAGTAGSPLNWAVGTIRGWLRPIQDRHLTWLYGRGVQHTYRHAQELLTNQPAHANALADALEALGRGVMAFRRRFTSSTAATWSLITMFSSGRLLGPRHQRDQLTQRPLQERKTMCEELLAEQRIDGDTATPIINVPISWDDIPASLQLDVHAATAEAVRVRQTQSGRAGPEPATEGL
ncbi:MAG: hypothetical protein QOE61_518 [Micromonosporaceae bacterium]|jgi:hypothetical protein|nr:hypothetical protein [Micromonosporaceae bacterium]